MALANEQFKGDEAQTKDFVKKLLHNVESFPTGAVAPPLRLLIITKVMLC
ncbi:hypothetical protein ACFOEM_14015 [Paenalcaligenes hominis]